MDVERYESCRNEYNRRKNLDAGHEDYINDMSGWLKLYQMSDVIPLVTAVQNNFAKFWELFNIDPNCHNSLPSMAVSAMFKNFDSNMPLCYSFHHNFEDIKNLLCDTRLGGITSCMARHVDLSGNIDSAHNARHVPNGEKVTSVISQDANSMYVWSQGQPMPLGPGLLWTKNGKRFRKQLMLGMEQSSMAALQWLYYEQERCLDKNGQQVQIQHAYFRGEHRVGKWKIDGFAIVDGQHRYYEFNGMLHTICFIWSIYYVLRL